jgi:hypothetical protein
MIKLLTLLVLSPWAYSAEFQSFKKCIETNIIELIQTDEFKSSNFIKYDDSQDDFDVKSWLEKDLFPGWDPSKKMTLDYLDKAWQIDRKTGMRYIYKLMFLMDRNYNIELMNTALAKQINNDAHLTCSGNVR